MNRSGWTIVHPIDEASPLAGVTEAELHRRGAELLVLLDGYEETFAQTVRSRTSYVSEEVVWGARFVRIIDADPDSSPVRVDLGRLSHFEPVPAPAGP